MTPGNWIALAGVVLACLSLLASTAWIVYRVGCFETRINVSIESLEGHVKSLLKGEAMPCALHARRLDDQERQLDALFRKLDAQPQRASDNGK